MNELAKKKKYKKSVSSVEAIKEEIHCTTSMVLLLQKKHRAIKAAKIYRLHEIFLRYIPAYDMS